MQSTLPLTRIIHAFMLVIVSSYSIRTVSADGSDDTAGCYKTGAQWKDLGNWDEVQNALDKNPVVNTPALHEGSDPVRSNRKPFTFNLVSNDNQVHSKVQIGDHCFRLDFSVSSGKSAGFGPVWVSGMLRHVFDYCPHGGHQKLEQIQNNKVIGHIWVKADPQMKSDCS